MRKIISAVVLFVFILQMTGCASIVSGQSQFIPVTTNPSGATVTINGRSKVTPATFQLPKGQKVYLVTIEKDGYNKVEVDLMRGMSGWFFANFALFGFVIIGMPVDLVNSSAYKYAPGKINETLTPIQTATKK